MFHYDNDMKDHEPSTRRPSRASRKCLMTSSTAFVEEGLVGWYKRFKPDAARSEDEEGAEEVEVNGEEQVDEAEAGPAAESIAFSSKRKSTGAPAVAAAPSAAAAEAGAAAAAAGPAAAAAGPAGPAAAAVGSKK